MFALFRVLMGLGVSSSSANLLFEMRPRRAGGLAVCTGLESPRDCKCCGTE